jgi:hypothetical protein
VRQTWRVERRWIAGWASFGGLWRCGCDVDLRFCSAKV